MSVLGLVLEESLKAERLLVCPSFLLPFPVLLRLHQPGYVWSDVALVLLHLIVLKFSFPSENEPSPST